METLDFLVHRILDELAPAGKESSRDKLVDPLEGFRIKRNGNFGAAHRSTVALLVVPVQQRPLSRLASGRHRVY